jgi:YYY domain-containing protein
MPDIYGLEKYMDFGFINSILRSDYFPPKDMWYTPLPINYYFFGHLTTAVLTKLSQIPSYISYNLMVATIFSLTITSSFSLGLNFLEKHKYKIINLIGGIFSSVLVGFGGNLTVIYSLFKEYTPADKPLPFWNLQFLPFNFPNGYWYPNATRFIPFTIHEFPLYSFVVSDLHGHVLDIPFVILIITLSFLVFNREIIRNLTLIFTSFILSVLYMTNAWDGFIYFLLIALVLFIKNFPDNNILKLLNFNYFYNYFKSLILIFLGFIAFSIPFSINFKPFVSGIGILCAPKLLTDLGKLGPFIFETNHCQKSPIWQLAVLYGFFYFFVLSLFAFLRFKKYYKLSKNDLFILILIFLSTLLIIIPEFIYIKDIYPLHFRANTMFKLTYQAFIMLSLCSGYIIYKLIININNRLIKIFFAFASFMLISIIFVYPFFAISSYYKNLKTYESLNGLKYIQNTYPEDYMLINWINNHIKGQPVILEANGDSYTEHARISSNTGLPTIIGWTVHEWLWRGTYDIVSPRIEEVKNIYVTYDLNLTKNLIKKYNISYVVISTLEKNKYPEINESKFKILGKIIYSNSKAKLYKITL